MNRPLRTLLACTDFSPHATQAVHRAARLAGAHAATLVLAHAYDAPTIVPAWGDPGGGAWVSEEQVSEGLRERLQREGAELATEYGIAVQTTLLTGSVHRRLVEHADATGADLLVVGAHGDTGLLGRLLGSTTQKILRLSHRPVLVVRTPATSDYARVLVATDFSEPAREAARLAGTLCPAARMWLLHAHEPALESRLAYARIDPKLGERYLSLALAEAGRALTEFNDALKEAGVVATPLLRQGHPSLLLPAAIDELDIQLLALGAQGKSLLESGLLGSVSQHAVAQSPCDVLVVPRAAGD
ncbi:universal stress protein [Rehaibacterium terrae]|jgi:nucleotide-binding universal stress UspA family protein|uniref:Nucleotide-binding universal stress UspA family protein n=1 Tax=Rehaibacterium terrae TaxID=1341696 RepID=A0A7W7XZT1_9GAMM|nr:universal stress protein [Rehaibacterium terrae]MBB5015313.1 nucleotide-binding universal stress UspA family protein [Rehaibacterium terrae]